MTREGQSWEEFLEEYLQRAGAEDEIERFKERRRKYERIRQEMEDD